MKKFFTLVSAALAAFGANAQTFDWNASTLTGSISEGAKLVDNALVEIVTANGDVAVTKLEDENYAPAPVEYFGTEFSRYIAIRVENPAPDASNLTGGAFSGAVALVLTAKQNVDVTLYYKVGENKSIDCFDQTDIYVTPIEQTSDKNDNGYLYCKGVIKCQADHKYTVWSKGGTIQLHAIATAEGTYVAPAPTETTIYYFTSASTVDGYSTIVYNDGAKLVLSSRTDKSWSAGSDITVGEKKYKGIKVSNGAQSTFVAPEGKKVVSVTIYSSVNADPTAGCCWSEINGVEYTVENAEMKSFKDYANPDVYTFDINATSFTFTNYGKQPVVVFEVLLGEADSTPTAVEEQNVNVENGVMYNLLGQKVDDSYKGIVIMNGKKYINK